MRKICLWLMCLVMVAGALQAPRSAAHAQADGTLHYNDGVIAVDYPSAWQASPFGDFLNRGAIFAPEAIAIDYSGGDPNILESTALEEALFAGTPVFGVWARPLSEVEGNPREILENLFAQYNVLRTEKAGPLTLENATGVEAIGTMEINGVVFGAHAVALAGQGRFILAIGGATEEVFAENRANFDQIVHSLRLLDAQHLPTPLPVSNTAGVEFSNYAGSGFSMLQPSDWQPESIETFDGSLTLFCTPPAEPTQPYNSDLTALDGFLATGTWSDPLSAEVVACVVGSPVAAVATVPLALLADGSGGDPAQAVLQRILSSGVVTQIQQARPISVSNDAGAEMLAVISDVAPQATAPYALYSLALVHDGWLVIFAASSPLAQFADNEAIFRTMAYSLVPQNLPDYHSYSGGNGAVISYGTEVDAQLEAGATAEWRFYGEAGDFPSISVTSTDFDAVLELDDANGTYLADNDDYDGTNPRIDYTLPASGYYIIKVTAYSVSTGGNYHLSLQVPSVIVN